MFRRKMYVIVILLSSLLSVLAIDTISTIGDRTIGGDGAQRYRYSFAVSIQFRKIHYCTGAIISQTCVLTAAHCKRDNFTALSVVAGLLNQREDHPDVKRLKVADFIQHPLFYMEQDRSQSYYDVALIKTIDQLQYTKAISRIPLAYYDDSDDEVYTLGWGFTQPQGSPATTLKYYYGDVITLTECGNMLSKKLADTNICLLSATAISCHGDSGGPLVQDEKLIGVAILSRCKVGYPAVFENIKYFINFIFEHATDVENRK